MYTLITYILKTSQGETKDAAIHLTCMAKLAWYYKDSRVSGISSVEFNNLADAQAVQARFRLANEVA